MTTIFLITNNYLFKNEMIYFQEKSKKEKKEKIPLSFKGEKKASELLKIDELKQVKTIYTSSYLSAIGTAKYLSEEKKLPIYIDERLNDQIIGMLENLSVMDLKKIQEQDENYKLRNGESINMVKSRIKATLKDILFQNYDSLVAIFTHDTTLNCLLSLWCEKGYSLENQLIFHYKDEVIVDGAYHPFRIYKLEFNGEHLKSIKWQKEKELN